MSEWIHLETLQPTHKITGLHVRGKSWPGLKGNGAQLQRLMVTVYRLGN